MLVQSMTTGRFVLLVPAPGRASWARRVVELAHAWCDDIELVVYASIDDLIIRLGSGRRHSAVLIAAGDPEIDEEITARAREVGCVTVLIGSNSTCSPRTDVSWGAHELVPSCIVARLAEVALRVPEVGYRDPTSVRRFGPPPWSGSLITVCGTGGTGASTIAIALTQGMSRLSTTKSILLADLALDADQHLFHPGDADRARLGDLIAAHRRRALDAQSIVRATDEVPGHPYRLLRGLRRHAEWTVLRPRATHAALCGLTASFDLTIADVDADVEGDRECGAIDVEERNQLARTSHRMAHVVVLVAAPGRIGLVSAARRLERLFVLGVEPGSVLVVINRASPPAADIPALESELARLVGHRVRALVAIPEHRIDWSGDRMDHLPADVVGPLQDAVLALLARPRRTPDPEPVERVRTTQGSWT